MIRHDTQGAVFETGAGGYLYVFNISDIGLIGFNTSFLPLTGIQEEVPVEVNKDINFRLIPLRVLYSLMWYGIYGMILEMGGYVGAEEIDKCVVWLVLVSAISELVIRSFPGPAAMVKA